LANKVVVQLGRAETIRKVNCDKAHDEMQNVQRKFMWKI